jgi:hypothetical protein
MKMTTKKKAAPKKAAAPPPLAPPAAEQVDVMLYGQRVTEHMRQHGVMENPWADMNAGGICGHCRQKV